MFPVCALFLATLMSAVTLGLPRNFDPNLKMVYSEKASGRLHSARGTASLAERLVANGAPGDLELAEEVLEALFECQELHKEDPHYGNFRWYLEDEAVEDLNAVEFVLSHLIPMMLQHGDRLPEALQEKVLDRIRLGLQEIQRLDVSVAYTNIATLDILNSCLGGELLRNESIARRGYQKLIALETLTLSNGTIFEFNSPTYLRVTMRALGDLIEMTGSEEARIRAKTLAARLALGSALRIHRRTGRLAGPHSRCYQSTLDRRDRPEVESLMGWIEQGIIPDWVALVVNRDHEPYQVFETAFADWKMGLSTYLGPCFAMGVATRQFGDQSNVFLIHYERPEQEKPGVVYSRYVVGDKWLGDFYHATDRSMSRNFNEEGEFWGVQNGPRAIGLYKPPSLHYQERAKAALIWTDRSEIDEIWISARRVEALPAQVPPGEIVVIGSGAVYIGVRPLTLTDLGRDAPIRLIEKGGDLVLEVHNYQGPKKAFWELEWPGGFYKGQPQCGFYAEAGERSAYASGKEFAAKIAEGQLSDNTAPPFTYAEMTSRPWTIEYSRDGVAVGIEVDLMKWELQKRWTEDGELEWPMLDSTTLARQNATGQVEVAGAILTCGENPAWLFADPDNDLYVAGYHGEPAPLVLEIPTGRVELESMSTGTVVWDNGCVEVESVTPAGEPKVVR